MTPTQPWNIPNAPDFSFHTAAHLSSSLADQGTSMVNDLLTAWTNGLIFWCATEMETPNFDAASFGANPPRNRRPIPVASFRGMAQPAIACCRSSSLRIGERILTSFSKDLRVMWQCQEKALTGSFRAAWSSQFILGHCCFSACWCMINRTRNMAVMSSLLLNCCSVKKKWGGSIIVEMRVVAIEWEQRCWCNFKKQILLQTFERRKAWKCWLLFCAVGWNCALGSAHETKSCFQSPVLWWCVCVADVGSQRQCQPHALCKTNFFDKGIEDSEGRIVLLRNEWSWYILVPPNRYDEKSTTTVASGLDARSSAKPNLILWFLMRSR